MFSGGGSSRNPPPSGATSSILEALSALTSSPYEDSDPPSNLDSSSQSASSNPKPTTDFINISSSFSLNPNSDKNIMDDSNQSDTSTQPITNPLEDVNSETQSPTTESFTPVILSVSSSSDLVESFDSTEKQKVSTDNTSSSNADTSTSGSSLTNVPGGLSSSSSLTTKPKLLNRSNHDVQKTVLQTNETAPENDSTTIDMIINGVKFIIGDFVYVKPPISPSNKTPLRQIVNIDRTWITADGNQMIRCTNYFRPMETSHKPTRKFFKKEVFQTDVSTIYQLSDVLGKCYVLGMNNYFTKTLEGPEPIKEANIYVCEYRYSEKYRYFKKIAAGSLPWNEELKLIDRSVPIEMVRVDASETEEKPQISDISNQIAVGSESSLKLESNSEKTSNLRNLRPVVAAEKDKLPIVKLKRIDETAVDDVIMLDEDTDSSSKKRKRGRRSGSHKNVDEDILSTDNSEDSDFDSDSGKEDEDVVRRKKARGSTRRGANHTFRCDTCNAKFEDQALLDLHAQCHFESEDEFSSPDGSGDQNWYGSKTKKKLKHRFTPEAQQELLNTILIHREELLAAKTIRDKTEVFKIVARELKDQQDGELTAKRCMDKWNNLHYQQKNYIRNKNKDGIKVPTFYHELEQILNNTPLPKHKQNLYKPPRHTLDDEDLPSIANSAQSKGQLRNKYRPSIKTVTLSADDDDLPSIANSAQSKVNKDGQSENARLMRAVSPTMLSNSPIISGANSPSHSPPMSPTPEFTPVTIVTSTTEDINKEMRSKDSLALPPEPQFSPPVTELRDNDDDASSSSIMLPPPPQFSPPVTTERSQRDPLSASEGTLRITPLSSLTAPKEPSGVSATSNNTKDIPQPSSFVPPPLLAASMLANQFTVGPLSHAVSQSLPTRTHPDNTVSAGQGPNLTGPSLLISQSGLPNQSTNQLNKMNANANKRSNSSRQSAAKSSATNSSTDKNQTRSIQSNEARPKTSIETMSENVGGIFEMCKQHLQLYKEEIELRRRSTKALERQAKIQELRLKEERNHRARFVALMENHGRNQNKEKDLENGEM